MIYYSNIYDAFDENENNELDKMARFYNQQQVENNNFNFFSTQGDLKQKNIYSEETYPESNFNKINNFTDCESNDTFIKNLYDNIDNTDNNTDNNTNKDIDNNVVGNNDKININNYDSDHNIIKLLHNSKSTDMDNIIKHIDKCSICQYKLKSLSKNIVCNDKNGNENMNEEINNQNNNITETFIQLDNYNVKIIVLTILIGIFIIIILDLFNR